MEVLATRVGELSRRVLAFYEADTGTVLLARDWDGADPIDQSVLLHALLHHAQVLPPASRYVGPGAEVAGRVGAWLDGA